MAGGGSGRANEPVGDEDREWAAAEQLRKVLARAEPLDEIESDLDEVAARGRGGRRVGHHLLHRPRHQRHAQQRHLRSWAGQATGWLPPAVCVDADAGNRQWPPPGTGVGGLLAGVGGDCEGWRWGGWPGLVAVLADASQHSAGGRVG